MKIKIELSGIKVFDVKIEYFKNASEISIDFGSKVKTASFTNTISNLVALFDRRFSRSSSANIITNVHFLDYYKFGAPGEIRTHNPFGVRF